MNRIVAVFLLSPLCLATTSCDSPSTVSTKAGCTLKAGGGGECSVSLEAKWEGGERKGGVLDALLARSALAPDAKSYVLDISGSTIPYPATGTMNVVLSNGGNGQVVSSRLFAWTRSGNSIHARDPDQINEWAYANGAGADSVRYEIIPFRSNFGSGTQTIAGISSYEGRELNRFSVVFDGTPDCPGYPTDTECRE